MTNLLSTLATLLFLFLPNAVSESSSANPPPNSSAQIDRKSIVTHFNPRRTSSNPNTPMQVGNGNFAFGADVTSLQTFLPFATMSSWGWKNDTLPPGRTQEDINTYQGVSYLNHGHPVQYDFGGPPDLEAWLRANPNRVNLARVGLVFRDAAGKTLNVSESDLGGLVQMLDLWTGKMQTTFTFGGIPVTVQTVSSLESDTISITLSSPLLPTQQGRLGLFIDFPWNDGSQKFSAPFVGFWDMPQNHTSSLDLPADAPLSPRTPARLTHRMVNNTFYTFVGTDAKNPFSITRDNPGLHRYTILPRSSSSTTFSVLVNFAPNSTPDSAFTSLASPQALVDEAASNWEDFWMNSGFVDVMTGSTDARAEELQRRIILSRYLMRVNEAGDYPPQESGLVNNGWYGKFHMEMTFWHLLHWALWNNWDILNLSSSIYTRFLPTSIFRAQVTQDWGPNSGARWPKMTDPSGRSAPGDINNLLVWQQPHPILFAEYEYRSVSSPQRKTQTLEKWRQVVHETADWMATFAWYNETKKAYDIGPPMYIVSEDTNPNVTLNAAFEVAYWRFGLGLARGWMERLGESPPERWGVVEKGLAKLPTVLTSTGAGEEELYAVYEGIEPDFWTDPTYTSSHPALVGLYGWLPKTGGVDLDMAKRTASMVWQTWNLTDCWGWDFPMLALSAARNNETDQALDFLLHPLFTFDDVGMPTGGVQVPTPYFPGAGGFLYAVAMMAAGWDGDEGRGPGAPGFPSEGWNVRVEGVGKAL